MGTAFLSQNGSSGLDSCGTGGGEGRPLQEALETGGWGSLDRPDCIAEVVQDPSSRRLRGRQAPGLAQDSLLGEHRSVGADEGGELERAGHLDKGLFGFGRLGDEQHQRPCSPEVACGVAAKDVATVGGACARWLASGRFYVTEARVIRMLSPNATGARLATLLQVDRDVRAFRDQ